jgi:hypothetical protein
MSELSKSHHYKVFYSDNKYYSITKVVLIRLGIYVSANKARGGGSPKIFINTL